MHITDPLQIVAGLGLPVLIFVFIAWIRQLLDDPSNDGLTVVLGLVFMVGILWIGFPLLMMGVDFWGQVFGLLGSA